MLQMGQEAICILKMVKVKRSQTTKHYHYFERKPLEVSNMQEFLHLIKCAHDPYSYVMFLCLIK